MAVTPVTANLAWQSVKMALAKQQGATGIPQVIRNQFDALKAHLAQTKNNPDLLFIPYLSTDIDDASGVILADAACTLYAVFGIKQATDTDVYLHILDDAADDTGVATDTRVLLSFLLTKEVASAFYPNGIPMAAGVVAKAYTTAAGVTDSSSADTPNGFVLVGAP